MIVGVDVHRCAHCAALIDERGVVLDTLSFPNTAAGVRKLRTWLSARDAGDAVIGIENGAGYGQMLCSALAAAGREVLNVPAWRTKRDRAKHGPGKSDPGDAVAIARVVLCDRERLGPALEPDLVRALAIVETQRRQTVARRTDAIQRLRALWTQFDPEAEVAVGNVLAARTLRRLRRVRLGNGVLGDTATFCLRRIVVEIARLDGVVRDLDKQLAELLAQSDDPLEGVCGAGPQVTATLIAQSGDVRRFRNRAAYARYGGVAPIPCGSGATAGRHRLHRGGNRQVNAALHRIAIVQAQWDPAARAYLERKLSEGKTPREARRALKRHLANLVYRRLYRWAENTLPATVS
ncbi:MAG: IS110 family transposase [Thermoleophilia bacterium]